MPLGDCSLSSSGPLQSMISSRCRPDGATSRSGRTRTGEPRVGAVHQLFVSMSTAGRLRQERVDVGPAVRRASGARARTFLDDPKAPSGLLVRRAVRAERDRLEQRAQAEADVGVPIAPSPSVTRRTRWLRGPPPRRRAGAHAREHRLDA